MRFARGLGNQILIYFDEYTRPDSVNFYLAISPTASIAVVLTELADYGWAGVLMGPPDVAVGFYEHGVYLVEEDRRLGGVHPPVDRSRRHLQYELAVMAHGLHQLEVAGLPGLRLGTLEHDPGTRSRTLERV